MLDQKDFKFAYRLWSRFYRHHDVDLEIAPFRNKEIQPSQNFLKKVRQAKFLPSAFVASKAEISKQAYDHFEKSEKNGTISINNLKRLAEVMDCELIYILRPLGKKNFAEMIWDILLEDAIQSEWLTHCFQIQKSRALAAVARDLMHNAKFRRKQNWVQKRYNELTPIPRPEDLSRYDDPN